jgi:hypothetical protein
MKFFEESRREVMKHIEKYMLEKMHEFLKPIDQIWQIRQGIRFLLKSKNFRKARKDYHTIWLLY